jgi:CBS domain-containing protein
MTEKIARRGVLVPAEQSIDFLELITAGSACTRQVVPLRADQPLSSARAFLSSLQPGHGHQGFPVLDGSGLLCGVVTRRDLLDPAAPPDALVASVVRRAPSFCFEENTLREAADLMVRAAVGRLPVVSKKEPRRVLGMLSRSDLLAAHASRLDDLDVSERSLQMPGAR